MLDSRLLYHLSVVLALGSMSQAARQLGVTQPTLSRNIRILEDRVGAPVVRRGRYGVTATEIGAQLAERGGLIAYAVRQAEQSIDEWRAGLTGELRVGVGPMLANTIMPGFFRETLGQRRPYALRVVTATAPRLVGRLNNGEIDLVLAPEQMNLHQERLSQTMIMEDRLAVFAGARSRLAMGAGPVPLDRLRHERWIVTGILAGIEGSSLDIMAQLGLADIVPALSFAGDVATALELLRTTAVISVLPARQIVFAPGLEAVHQVPVDVELPQRNIAVWVAKANRDRPEIAHFIRAVQVYVNALLADAS